MLTEEARMVQSVDRDIVVRFLVGGRDLYLPRKTRMFLGSTLSCDQWVRVAPFAGGKAAGREFAFVTCTEASSPLLSYDNKFKVFPYGCYRS